MLAISVASAINLRRRDFSSTILIYSSILAAVGTVLIISVRYSTSPTCFNWLRLTSSDVTVVKSIGVPLSQKSDNSLNIIPLASA